MKFILIIPFFFWSGVSFIIGQTDSLIVNLGAYDSDSIPPGIPFVAYWEVGDVYDFKITKIKKRWNEDELIRNDSSSYIARFTVLDSTETNYRIKWTYKTPLTELQLPVQIIKKVNEFNITEIIYKTNEVGEFITIENWEEVSKAMKSMFSVLIEEISAEEDVSRSDMLKVIRPMMNLYESKEGIESHLLKELQYFHFPFGVEFSAVDTIFYEEDMPNALGGDPIRSDVLLFVDSVDYENSFCILEQGRTLNSEDTKRFLKDFFIRVAKSDEQNEDMQTALKESKFDIQDINTYQYYYYPGIPLKISCLRKTIMKFSGENKINIELTKIELQI